MQNRTRIGLFFAFLSLFAFPAPAFSLAFTMEPDSILLPYDCSGCGPTRPEEGFLRVEFLDGESLGATSLLLLQVTNEIAAEPFEPGVDITFDVPLLGATTSTGFVIPLIVGPDAVSLQFMSRVQGVTGIASIELGGIPTSAVIATNSTTTNVRFSPAVPEPSAAMLYGLGLAITSWHLRRR